MVNPYNQQIYRIDLSPEAVDGFVFWTKNIGPFLKHLPALRQRGYPFIVQQTINGYGRELEYRVINYTNTIEHMKKLVGDYGPDVAIWRYDPIIISSLTPVDWHRRTFEMLAKSLAGTTNEVVVSFGQVYKKTQRNMDWAARKFGFQWSEHEAMTWEDVCKLVSDLARIAGTHGMQLRVCSQQALLIPGVIEEARCVDADRLERVSGKVIMGKTRQKGNRKECGCFACRDIGEYDTCPHGCVYCYAVQHRELALERYRAHDPNSEFLFPPKDSVPSGEEMKVPQIIPTATVQKKERSDKIVQEKLF